MPKIIRSQLSRADLAEIWRYIARDSVSEADRFIMKIDKRLANLAANPLMGRSRAELAPELYSFPVGKVVVFYVPFSEGIQVARILRGARDVQSDWFRSG